MRRSSRQEPEGKAKGKEIAGSRQVPGEDSHRESASRSRDGVRSFFGLALGEERAEPGAATPARRERREIGVAPR
jgi:hypothetical protein